MFFHLFVVVDQYPDERRPVLRTAAYELGEVDQAPTPLTASEVTEALTRLSRRRLLGWRFEVDPVSDTNPSIHSLGRDMTEFRQFIETLRRLGVSYDMNWDPAYSGQFPGQRRGTFERIMDKGGYKSSLHNMSAVVLGDLYYVFSTSEPHWTTYEDDPEDFAGHKGWGEDGMFMFSWNKETDDYDLREYTDGKGTILDGIRAIERTHGGPFPKFTPRG